MFGFDHEVLYLPLMGLTLVLAGPWLVSKVGRWVCPEESWDKRSVWSAASGGLRRAAERVGGAR